MAARPAEASVNDPEWETSKENVQPLKRGRNVRRLNRVLGREELSAKELKKKQQAWKKRIAKAAKSEDPLSSWIDYIRWIEDHLPSGGVKTPVETALEEVTSQFSKDPRYRNDTRYVALWIRLANMAKDPAPTFRYLWSKRIGEGCALFYMAWGHVAERDGRFTVAERVYSHGVRRGTDKRERLAARHAMFRRRMVAQWKALQGARTSGPRGSSPSDSTAASAKEVEVEWKDVDLGRLEAQAAGVKGSGAEAGIDGAVDLAGDVGDGPAAGMGLLGAAGEGPDAALGASAGAAAGAGGAKRRRPLGVLAVKPGENARGVGGVSGSATGLAVPQDRAQAAAAASRRGGRRGLGLALQPRDTGAGGDQGAAGGSFVPFADDDGTSQGHTRGMSSSSSSNSRSQRRRAGGPSRARQAQARPGPSGPGGRSMDPGFAILGDDEEEEEGGAQGRSAAGEGSGSAAGPASGAGSSRGGDEQVEAARWPQAPGLRAGRKENEGPVTGWDEGGLARRPPVAKVLAAGGPSLPAFEVFQEEEEEEEEEDGHGGPGAAGQEQGAFLPWTRSELKQLHAKWTRGRTRGCDPALLAGPVRSMGGGWAVGADGQVEWAGEGRDAGGAAALSFEESRGREWLARHGDVRRAVLDDRRRAWAATRAREMQVGKSETDEEEEDDDDMEMDVDEDGKEVQPLQQQQSPLSGLERVRAAAARSRERRLRMARVSESESPGVHDQGQGDAGATVGVGEAAAMHALLLADAGSQVGKITRGGRRVEPPALPRSASSRAGPRQGDVTATAGLGEALLHAALGASGATRTAGQSTLAPEVTRKLSFGAGESMRSVAPREAARAERRALRQFGPRAGTGAGAGAGAGAGGGAAPGGSSAENRRAPATSARTPGVYGRTSSRRPPRSGAASSRRRAQVRRAAGERAGGEDPEDLAALAAMFTVRADELDEAGELDEVGGRGEGRRRAGRAGADGDGGPSQQSVGSAPGGSPGMEDGGLGASHVHGLEEASSFAPGDGGGGGVPLVDSEEDDSRSVSSRGSSGSEGDSGGDHGRSARSDVSAGVLRMAAQASVLHGDSESEEEDENDAGAGTGGDRARGHGSLLGDTASAGASGLGAGLGAAATGEVPSAGAGHGGDEGVTINTKLALEDMDALFGADAFGADAFGEASGIGHGPGRPAAAAPRRAPSALGGGQPGGLSAGFTVFADGDEGSGLGASGVGASAGPGPGPGGVSSPLLSPIQSAGATASHRGAGLRGRGPLGLSTIKPTQRTHARTDPGTELGGGSADGRVDGDDIPVFGDCPAGSQVRDLWEHEHEHGHGHGHGRERFSGGKKRGGPAGQQRGRPRGEENGGYLVPPSGRGLETAMQEVTGGRAGEGGVDGDEDGDVEREGQEDETGGHMGGGGGGPGFAVFEDSNAED